MAHKKRRVLFVLNQFFKGGAETALLHLLSALDPEHYEIDLLLYDQIQLDAAISLVTQIPSWVTVIDVKGAERRYSPRRVWAKLREKIFGKAVFRPAAVRHLREREYDVAIAYGEWFSCALTALEAQAKRKYLWIHADLDKADFLHPDILHYHSCFDGFIYASERSRQSAVSHYPELGRPSFVVHNMVDRAVLLARSRETPKWSWPEDGLPMVLTVANIRPEKNHLRQVEAMKLLAQRGLRFHWVNLGAQTDIPVIQALRKAVKAADLENYFHLPGALENPWPLMKRADAVCVLSDHESWSMVITEAKSLRVPVLATRTSGALEQIEDGKTGLLCDFTPEDIADKLEALLTHPEVGDAVRASLKDFSPAADTLTALEPLLWEEQKQLLYVFDDINYQSGARNAALAQMELLSSWARVTAFSAEPARADDQTLAPWRVLDLRGDQAFRSLSRPIQEVWRDPDTRKRVKLIRLLYALLARLGLDGWLYHRLLRDSCPQIMERYDVVCVVSEASKLRQEAARLKGPRKLQWIHTDYVAWRARSSWTRSITSKDGALYTEYDAVICLSDGIRQRMAQLYPHLMGKLKVIPNPIRWEEILERAGEPCAISVEKSGKILITVGRLESEKRYDRLLMLAAELKRRRICFHWYLVGGGPLRTELPAQAEALDVADKVTFTGPLDNPLPLLKRCDLFVLLSDYEGTPVTVDECKVLGVPVLAADVGGIKDQLMDGAFGQTVPAGLDTAALAEHVQGLLEQPVKPKAPADWAPKYNEGVARALTTLFQG